MTRAVFLDRDGVLTALVYYPDTGEYESARTPADLTILPNTLSALQRLRDQGWALFLVSNQPSYAKGKTSLDNLHAVHARFEEALQRVGVVLHASYYCYHHPRGIVPSHTMTCECRKPGIASLLRAQQEFGLDLAQSWFVGDQDIDIQCGQRGGCQTIQLDYSLSADKRGTSQPDWRCRDLDHAVELLCGG